MTVITFRIFCRRGDVLFQIGIFKEDDKQPVLTVQLLQISQLAVQAAYTGNEEEAMEWKKELQEQFPGYEIYMAPLSLSVSCHIGPGALAVAATKIADTE